MNCKVVTIFVQHFTILYFMR